MTTPDPEIGKPQTEKKYSGPRRSVKEREWTLHGWNACRRAFEKRPEDLLRLYFRKDRSRGLSHVKKWCSDHKLPYRQLEEDALQKTASGMHHEGVVMVFKPHASRTVYQLTDSGLPANGFAVALDRLENSHNVGAVIRSCGYFGAAGLVLEKEHRAAAFAPSTARMAEGALEDVPVYECTNLPSALRDLKGKGVFILGAEPDAKQSLYEIDIPFPCMLVLGNESAGLSSAVKQRCDARVRIPGLDTVQSLNVSVAAGVVLGELFRRLHAGEAKK